MNNNLTIKIMNRQLFVPKSMLGKWEIRKKNGKTFLFSESETVSFLIELAPFQVASSLWGTIRVMSLEEDPNLNYYSSDCFYSSYSKTYVYIFAERD